MYTDGKDKSGLFSHPNVYIEDHINRCLELAMTVPKLQILQDIKNREILDDIVTVMISLHDFGKCTEYFQNYITGKKNVGLQDRSHATLSGLYALYTILKYAGKDTIFNDPFNVLITVSAYLSIKKHHGAPDNFSEEIRDIDEQLMTKQSTSLMRNKDRINMFINNINIPEKLKTFMFIDDQFYEWINSKEYRSVLRKLARYFSENNITGTQPVFSVHHFQIFQYFFSLLLSSDKLEAGIKTEDGVKVTINRTSADVTCVVIDRYKTKKFKNVSGDINLLREKAYHYVLHSIDKTDLSQRIYTITLPTGTGKTLTGLGVALKLREKLDNSARIIYSLPFISIIDQNANIYEQIFENTNARIIKHHYLSSPDKLTEDILSLSYSSAKLIMENWEGDIIITTFVQFFHTLVSTTNDQFMRFSKFANSIIVLDEIQALPHEYWKLIEETLLNLAEKFNAYIIIMTATQPYIFTEPPVELVSKDLIEEAREKLNRYTLHVDLAEKTIEQFVSGLMLDDNKSYLFIANTIRSSINLYDQLKAMYGNKYKMCYLSNNITPYDRKKRIKEIQDGEYQIVVTTQLVEAGVDIDFDVVYRDLSPLDSIVQSAGRCNRNNKKAKGNVHVVKLVNEKGNPYYNRIYDPVLMQETEKILCNINSMDEKDIYDIVDRYFRNLKECISDDNSLEILKDVKFFNIKNIYKNFHLIEEEPHKVDVFILQEQAEGILNTVREIYEREKHAKSKEERFKIKEEFDRIKSEFYQFVISVNRNKITEDKKASEYRDFFMPVIQRKYYDEETGFDDSEDDCPFYMV